MSDPGEGLGGAGAALAPLEWDVKLYLALDGALHDAAVAAWELKRAYTTAIKRGPAGPAPNSGAQPIWLSRPR